MNNAGLRGWLDYDRDKLPALTAAEQIDYFEKRVRLVAVNPLRRILATEISPAPDSSALLIFGVSLCCAIEAAGKFLDGGRGSNQQRFAAFVDRYMAPDFKMVTIGNERNVALVWKHFRNGLAHGFSVCHGGFEGHPSEPYFRVATVHGKQCLEMNPTRFLDDFQHGFERYLADLRRAASTDPIRQDFHAVFKDVFVLGN
jgi:hypothetical protein